MRFVIDDGAFRGWDAPTLDLPESVSLLSELLLDLRGSRKPVGILGGWGSLQVTEADDLATVLASRFDMIDRDLGSLLLGLLSKCIVWDDGPSVVVSDDDLRVDEMKYASLGVAYAAAEASEGRGVGVVTMVHTGFAALCHVSSEGFGGQLVFVVRPSDCKYFYRSLYSLEDIAQSSFFDLVVEAFPDLCFAADITFSKFYGGYSQRDRVVAHLSALNDEFMRYYISEHGNSAQISANIGIDVSIEGNTRSSERLMAMRDVIFEGRKYRCEWHSKLEPHRNRIHFYPGDSTMDGKILIGIFVDHLPT